jgi:predicted kinase
MKELILLRGLPGSGKSSFAKLLGGNNYEADQYFIDQENGEYKFDSSKIKLAHGWCKLCVGHAMEDGLDRIVVSNTFTQEWEMEAYYKLAEQYGYRVYSLIVENRHEGINEHNVPEGTLKTMKKRFEICL